MLFEVKGHYKCRNEQLCPSTEGLLVIKCTRDLKATFIILYNRENLSIGLEQAGQ